MNRRLQLKEFAKTIGFTYSPHMEYEHSRRYQHFGVFQTGGSERYSSPTIRGSITVHSIRCPCILGDFNFSSYSSGSDGDGYQQLDQLSYLIVHLPIVAIPGLRVDLESNRFAPVDGLLKNVLNRDIDFESDQFNNKYDVRCDDRHLAFQVMHPAMMEFLLDTHPSGFHIHGDQYCCANGRRWSIAQFSESLEWSLRFFELLPRHLLDRQPPTTD